MTRLSIRAVTVQLCLCFFLCGGLALAWFPIARAQQPTSPIPPTQNAESAVMLELGKPIEREIVGGQKQVCWMRLQSRQYLRVTVEQYAMDVALALYAPNGSKAIEIERGGGGLGTKVLSWITDRTGEWRLEVFVPAQATMGRFDIRLDELRAAKTEDRDLVEAIRLDNEALVLNGKGKRDDAIAVAQRALALKEQALGAEHLEVAQSLYNLGVLYGPTSTKRSEQFFQGSLAIREKLLGPEHPEVARVLNGLGIAARSKGDYVQAEALHKRAIAIREKTFGSEHPILVGTINNLAYLYAQKGNFADAESLYRWSLRIWEKTLGVDHPELFTALGNLADIYVKSRDYVKAEPLYLRALSIMEKSGAAGTREAIFLAQLALFYQQQGAYTKAEPLYLQALAIRERLSGADSISAASARLGLAECYRAQNAPAQAETNYSRVLSIVEKFVGNQHHDLAFPLEGLAWAAIQKGEPVRAINYLTRYSEIREIDFAHNLGSGSERQKLSYLDYFSYSTRECLALHPQFAPNDPLALKLALTTALRRKGRVLDATADNIALVRQRATAQEQTLLKQLIDARAALAKATLSGPGTTKPEAYRAQLKQLDGQADKIEADLGLLGAELRAETQPITLDTVQAAIPAGTALIELTVHIPLETPTQKAIPPRYIAYVLTAQGEPHWADLGDAATIDRAIEAWRKALGNPKRNDVRRLARAVDEKVMRPVRALLGERTQLLIAPDGLLNLIPFAALVDERNRYLVERYSIHYLTSGRDLLRLQVARESKSEPVAVADPAFGIAALKPASTVKDERLQPSFQPLPVTADEADGIKNLLPGTTVLMQKDATEAALKRLVAPRILHIATHGFFLNDQEAPPVDARGSLTDDPLRTPDARLAKWAAQIENPLLRSGLALAGANLGKNGDDDGLLTAMEAAGLNLWGTKLVVLSACDTGVGEIKNGEGVYGLRRALVLAGAETLVMSLWPVSDVRTKDLMLRYYAALNRGEGRGEALRRVQLKMLRGKQRHPFYWAGFLQLGEWANLDGKR